MLFSEEEEDTGADIDGNELLVELGADDDEDADSVIKLGNIDEAEDFA